MDEPRAQRTLVKSPPELWAEVSDVAALARHLGEFGEIRITRLEPETTVAWEGDRARGTVRLEPAGWGTRVTLTAELSGSPGDGEAGGGEEATEPAAATAAGAAPPARAPPGAEPGGPAAAAGPGGPPPPAEPAGPTAAAQAAEAPAPA